MKTCNEYKQSGIISLRAAVLRGIAPLRGGTTMSTTGTNLKQTPFSAIVVDTYAAENEQQISVTAGTEVIVLDNRQSSTMWQVSIGGKGKEIGWIPSSILVFDGMMTPWQHQQYILTIKHIAWQNGHQEQPIRRLPFTSNNDYRNINQNRHSASRSESNGAPSFHNSW